MTRLRSQPPVSLPEITRTYHGPNVSGQNYSDEFQQSVARFKARMPSLSCLYNSLDDEPTLHSSAATSSTEAVEGSEEDIRDSDSCPYMSLPPSLPVWRPMSLIW